MTEALDSFEREMYKSDLLTFALMYVSDNESKLKRQLAAAIEKGVKVQVRDYPDFRRALTDAVTVGSLALFWRAFETHDRAVFHGRSGIQTIISRCPEFQVPCHRHHRPAHVLTILKNVRDRELHSLATYNTIACDRPPDSITLQPVFVREYEDRREVLLFHDLTIAQQLAWRRSTRLGTVDNLSTTLGEFMVGEARECLRRFDALSTRSGAARRGKRLPLVKATNFAVLPEFVPTSPVLPG